MVTIYMSIAYVELIENQFCHFTSGPYMFIWIKKYFNNVASNLVNKLSWGIDLLFCVYRGHL